MGDHHIIALLFERISQLEKENVQIKERQIPMEVYSRRDNLIFHVIEESLNESQTMKLILAKQDDIITKVYAFMFI